MKVKEVMSIVRWSNVPVPEGHLTALALGSVLHRARPMHLPVPAPVRLVFGPAVISVGALVAASAAVAASDVDVRSPVKLVTRGPYAFSRNPMYVGWTIAYLGVTLAVGSRWLLVMLPPVLAYTHLAVLREERHLEARFGPDYARYRELVRRYV
jgi:protein-S-isoprenylcysteine O-methyltransferase Ste14